MNNFANGASPSLISEKSAQGIEKVSILASLDGRSQASAPQPRKRRFALFAASGSIVVLAAAYMTIPHMQRANVDPGGPMTAQPAVSASAPLAAHRPESSEHRVAEQSPAVAEAATIVNAPPEPVLNTRMAGAEVPVTAASPVTAEQAPQQAAAAAKPSPRAASNDKKADSVVQTELADSKKMPDAKAARAQAAIALSGDGNKNGKKTGSPAKHKDADEELVTVLLTRVDKQAPAATAEKSNKARAGLEFPDSGGASAEDAPKEIADAQSKIATPELLGRCEQFGWLESFLCKSRICSQRKGDPACANSQK